MQHLQTIAERLETFIRPALTNPNDLIELDYLIARLGGTGDAPMYCRHCTTRLALDGFCPTCDDGPGSIHER